VLTSAARTPVGLEDVSRYPYLLAELARTKGWTMSQLEKLAGRNFLRVFRKVEKVQYSLSRLHKTSPHSR
jgi:membrane dipeptidase